MKKICLWTTVLLAASIVLFPGTFAFAGDYGDPVCTAAMLDFRAWPVSSAENGIHFLVIEIQNREEHGCKLPEGSLEFYPPNHGHESVFRDDSESAQAFTDRHNELGPGDLVHQVVIWSSVPFPRQGIPVYTCRTEKDMELTLGVIWSQTEPDLNLRNIQIKSCDTWWSSRYRLGGYVPGESVAAGWLRLFALSADDLKPAFPEQPQEPATANPEVALHPSYRVEYVGFWNIGLILPHPASAGCPFAMMRKREADGKTEIYLDPCEAGSAKPDGGALKNESIIDLRGLGLQPRRTGNLEYQAISRVLEGNSPRFVQSRPVQIEMRDGTEPLVPEIGSKIPACGPSQLKLSGEPVQLGQHWNTPGVYAPPGQEWYFAQAYEFTNVSEQTCLVGGLPSLRLLQGPKMEGVLQSKLCANCSTPLFEARPGVWIDMKAHDSAHFLVATRAYDSDYWAFCTAVGRLELTLPGGPDAIPLPFAAPTCGLVFVTTWRAGKYDGDPLNTRYAAARNSVPQLQDEPTLLPKECADADLKTLGRPVLVDEGTKNEVLFGFSVGNGRATYGQQVPIYFWTVNQSDQPQGFMSCDLQWLQRDGFDVFDAKGHRVLTRDEQKNPQYRRSEASVPFDYTCDMNRIVRIAPHACNKPEKPFDLAELYVLTEGDYVISPRKTVAYIPQTGGFGAPKAHPGRLVISIEPQQRASGSHGETDESNSSEIVP